MTALLAREGKKRVRWPLVLAGSGALLIVLGISTARETYRGWQVDAEIQGLQRQVEELEGRRASLEQLVQVLQSPDALDKEARLRLGWKKPGEKVVVIRGMDASQGIVDSSAIAPVPSVTTSSNVEKWFRYFFVKQSS